MVADWVVKLHEKKVGYLMSLIVLMLGSSDKILDLGSGSGEISKALIEAGYKVTSMDVAIDKVKVGGEGGVLTVKIFPLGIKSLIRCYFMTVLHHVAWYTRFDLDARIGWEKS